MASSSHHSAAECTTLSSANQLSKLAIGPTEFQKTESFNFHLNDIPFLVSGHETITQPEKWMLQKKKLALLIYLDHTLVHSVPATLLNNKDLGEGSEDVFRHETSSHNGVKVAYSRVRPLAREFLGHLQTYFELYFCTIRSKEYISQLTRFLDPTGQLIKPANVFSEEDFPYRYLKASIIMEKFKTTFEMLIILDNTYDSWDAKGHPPYNLICVHPPHYVQSVENEAGDGDVDYLYHLAKNLQHVHHVYYRHYEKYDRREIPSTDEIISKLTKPILGDVNVVFSAMFSQDLSKEFVGRALCVRLAEGFAAKVKNKVNNNTYCVISAKPGTDTCMAARKCSVPVVHPNWLAKCSENWERPRRRDFVLTEDNKPTWKWPGKEISIFQKPKIPVLSNVVADEQDCDGCVMVGVVAQKPKEPMATITLDDESDN